MARISVAATVSGRTVTIRGRLKAADLHRLERACGPALEQRDPNLALVMRDAAAGDSAARAYLDRLQARGAVIRG
jgi:hypothetical protein